MRLSGLFLVFGVPLLGGVSGIPEPVIPAGVGVNIHFVTGHKQDLDLIAAAGFKFVRMDFQWEAIETSKGAYDWSAYDELLGNLESRGLRALLILDYSHHLYEQKVTSPHPLTGKQHETIASPQHPDSVEAFARWAAASAKHYRGRHVLWEIWNEPNGHFWSPKPDVGQYTALVLAASKTIRQADPQATIVAPATSGFPWEFLESFVKSGALEFLDGVTVHPYRDHSKPPETAGSDYERLRQLIERYAPEAKKGRIPILCGEWGYSSHQDGVSLETQATFAARQQLSNLLKGVPLSVWYDWKNDGDDPKENEHNFGTVWPDLKPKPAYLAIQTLIRELSGYRVAHLLTLPSEKDFALVCTNGTGQAKLAAWTMAEPHSTTISNDLNNLSIVLQLGPLPQYVTFGRTRRK
jgi:hypothetical protein